MERLRDLQKCSVHTADSRLFYSVTNRSMYCNFSLIATPVNTILSDYQNIRKENFIPIGEEDEKDEIYSETDRNFVRIPVYGRLTVKRHLHNQYVCERLTCIVDKNKTATVCLQLHDPTFPDNSFRLVENNHNLSKDRYYN